MMPFDLFNTLPNFQVYINKILAKKLNIILIVYLNDIFIYTNKADYVLAVWWVLNQLRKYFLYVILKKCYFSQKVVQFFSYMAFLQSVYIEDKQIEAAYNWLKL